VDTARFVLELPLVRTDRRVNGPAMVQVRLSLIHMILVVLLLIMVLVRSMLVMRRDLIMSRLTMVRLVMVSLFLSLKEQRIARISIELGMLNMLIMMLNVVVVISVARLVVEHMTLLGEAFLRKVHH